MFTTQLEKSREATDLATVRNAYADYQMCKMTGELPDGSADTADGTEFIYTKTGDWIKCGYSNPADKSMVYFLKSKSDLSEIKDYLSSFNEPPNADSGYMGHAIVISYFMPKDGLQFFVWPESYLPLN